MSFCGQMIPLTKTEGETPENKYLRCWYLSFSGKTYGLTGKSTLSDFFLYEKHPHKEQK